MPMIETIVSDAVKGVMVLARLLRTGKHVISGTKSFPRMNIARARTRSSLVEVSSIPLHSSAALNQDLKRGLNLSLLVRSMMALHEIHKGSVWKATIKIRRCGPTKFSRNLIG